MCCLGFYIKKGRKKYLPQKQKEKKKKVFTEKERVGVWVFFLDILF